MSKPSVYLDSCCFIDYVKKHVGVLPQDREHDVWFVKELLLAHRRGELVATTSLVAVGECLAIGESQDAVPEEAKTLYRSLLTSGQYVRLIYPTMRTPRLIQDFRWNHGLVLGSPDAIHFASAVEAKCSEFITTDSKLRKPKVVAASAVLSGMGLRMITAPQTALLPSSVLQASLINPAGASI